MCYNQTINQFAGENDVEKRFETFTTLIANINRSIRKIKTEEMSKFNLKSVHVSCLYYLYKQRSLTVKELCDMCDEDKANISRSVEHLEACGYIAMRPKDAKKYKAPLDLTADGDRVGEIIACKVDRILDESSVGLSEEERAVLYRSLGIICNNLQRICDNYDLEN